MTKRQQTITISAVLIATIATIAGAWAFEIIGRYEPCALCLQQRWPYYIVIPLAAIAWALAVSGKYPRMVTVSMLLTAAIMTAGAALGIYHAGVEWHWWAGPSACAGTDALSSGKSLLPDLSLKPVLCTEAALRIFGISLAGYNAIIAAVIALFAFRAARRT